MGTIFSLFLIKIMVRKIEKRMLSLPNDVLVSVLGQWLTVQSLRYLDSAFCSTTKRHQFLVIIGSNLMVCLHNIYLNDNALNWLVLRSISATSISLRSENHSLIKKEKFFSNKLISKLTTLALHSTALQDFNKIISVCGNLTALDFSIQRNCLIDDTSVELITSSMATTIRTLNFEDCREITDKSLHSISVYCKQLAGISLNKG